MGRNKAPLRFDVTDDAFAPKKPVQGSSAPVTKTNAVKAGLAEGFTPRSKSTKIDGRSLRRTDRGIQFNISVSQQTKDSFWRLAQAANCSSGGQFLEILLSTYQKNNS